tara:strand:- start:5017 stop:5193 length:177 start_codon:yes stop_codon:yes gene_type:complete
MVSPTPKTKITSEEQPSQVLPCPLACRTIFSVPGFLKKEIDSLAEACVVWGVRVQEAL